MHEPMGKDDWLDFMFNYFILPDITISVLNLVNENHMEYDV